MKHKSTGFTIVELLIVIVVIGILASILVVSYTGVQKTSRTQSAAANASVIQRKIESYLSLNNTYPTATTAAAYTTALNSSTESNISTTGLTLGPIPAGGSSTVIEVSQCASGNAGAFFRLRYWDFTTGTYSTQAITASALNATCSSWNILP